MAHSIQTARGRHLIANDFDLVAIASLSNLLAKEAGDGRFADILSIWNGTVANSGVGCLDFEFDRILASEQMAGELHLLVQTLAAKISTYGDTVPANVLQSSGDVSFSDTYPTRFLIEAVRGIKDLIQ